MRLGVGHGDFRIPWKIIFVFIRSSNKINPTWCALKESHGHESEAHKLFMRYTGKGRSASPSMLIVITDCASVCCRFADLLSSCFLCLSMWRVEQKCDDEESEFAEVVKLDASLFFFRSSPFYSSISSIRCWFSSITGISNITPSVLVSRCSPLSWPRKRNRFFYRRCSSHCLSTTNRWNCIMRYPSLCIYYLRTVLKANDRSTVRFLFVRHPQNQWDV